MVDRVACCNLNSVLGHRRRASDFERLLPRFRELPEVAIHQVVLLLAEIGALPVCAMGTAF